jgi:hypothetical protein
MPKSLLPSGDIFAWGAYSSIKSNAMRARCTRSQNSVDVIPRAFTSPYHKLPTALDEAYKAQVPIITALLDAAFIKPSELERFR